MVSTLLPEAETRMGKATESLAREMNSVRTGRASPVLVEKVVVDYYGAQTPLNQLATVTAPEGNLLVIQPWDRQAIPAIEKGILKSSLGLNPASDGVVIRVPIPQATEERRRDFVKLLKKQAEESRIEVRNIRRDIMEKLRAMERNKEISQDENRRYQEQLQKLTDAFTGQIDEMAITKEAEVMEV